MPTTPSRSYLNAVLTIIAVLLGLNLLVQVSGLPAGSSAAHAQSTSQPNPAPIATPANPAEQRIATITALDAINRRLGNIESKLDRGLNVKVTEMPAVKVSEMPTPRD